MSANTAVTTTHTRLAVFCCVSSAPLFVAGFVIALRIDVSVPSVSTNPTVSFELTTSEMKMSVAVYQGSAWPRLAKMDVTFGTTATIITLMSAVPMMIIKTG